MSNLIPAREAEFSDSRGFSMEDLIEEAFRVAILTEKNSYDLYRSAGLTMPDEGAGQVFKRLEREQRKVIDELLKYCPDISPEAVKDPNEEYVRSEAGLKESPERQLFNHLRIALLDKHRCIEHYVTCLDTFREPEVCKLFELMLSMSRKQYGRIAEEYRQADLRLRKPAVSKRAKRTHIRSGNSPTPNEHSQLFISLLDSGRHSPS